jgi:hypothetical protein
MRRSGFHRKLTSWIACAGLLMAALAPSISMALRAGDPIAVCPAHEAHDEGDAHDKSPLARLLFACLYCSVHAPNTDLPPQLTLTVAQATVLVSAPPAIVAVATFSRPWNAASPRAPPAVG